MSRGSRSSNEDQNRDSKSSRWFNVKKTEGSEVVDKEVTNLKDNAVGERCVKAGTK